jgi:hypothetical protein
MPIVRGEHSFDSHFTQIPNAWLRDNRLSYKARGLLAELMSHSVGFEVSIKRLASKGVDGRDSIASAISELEAIGYLKREQLRNLDGTLASTLWTTKDPEAPWTDFPSTANPITDNPHLKKNNYKNTEIKNNYAQKFELFWDKYPRKVGKGAAEKAFVKALMEVDDRERSELSKVIIKAALALAQDPNLPEQQFIPHASTWLNREGWLDEPYPERQRTPEERAEALKANAQLERERRIKQSAELIEEMVKAKENASPAPKCEHGASIVSCKSCLRKSKGN